MSDDMELTSYQRAVVEKPFPKQILIGGRQIGKTETVIRRAARAIDDGKTVAAPTMLHSRARELAERLSDYLWDNLDSHYRQTLTHVSNDETNGRFDAYSVNVSHPEIDFDRLTDRALEGHEPDLFVVDEAHHIPERYLFMVENEWDADVLLTGTPTPQRHLVDIWAEHSPYWRTTHATSRDAPFTNDGYIRQLEDDWSDEKVALEVYGAYEQEERA